MSIVNRLVMGNAGQTWLSSHFLTHLYILIRFLSFFYLHYGLWGVNLGILDKVLFWIWKYLFLHGVKFNWRANSFSHTQLHELIFQEAFNLFLGSLLSQLLLLLILHDFPHELLLLWGSTFGSLRLFSSGREDDLFPYFC